MDASVPGWSGRRRDRTFMIQFVLILLLFAALWSPSIPMLDSCTANYGSVGAKAVLTVALMVWLLVIFVAWHTPLHAGRTWYLWPAHRLVGLSLLWFGWIVLNLASMEGGVLAREPDRMRHVGLASIFVASVVAWIGGWIIPLVLKRRSSHEGSTAPLSHWEASRLPLWALFFLCSAFATLLAYTNPPQLGLAPNAAIVLEVLSATVAVIGALLVLSTPRPISTAPRTNRFLRRGVARALQIVAVPLYFTAPGSSGPFVFLILVIAAGRILRASPLKEALSAALPKSP
ncbi:MAG: hypothetical protein JXA57_15440 [Armatimonadetes bacterium]|nr:hypothetical protein [Armatimonadota bacterium]